MKVMDCEFAKEFWRLCDDAWNLGWHEYHAGNLSYRLKREETEMIREDLDAQGEWRELGSVYSQLAGEFFMVTSGGSSFHEILKSSDELTGIVELDPDGRRYRVRWGLCGNHPTSELPAHLMNHAVKKVFCGDDYRIIYHAHPGNLTALSFVLPLSDEVFTRELWEMEPECAMTFPAGMGVLPWCTPGSEEAAFASGEKMKVYDVILWAHHGAFASGKTFGDTFGLMYTVEKASEMLVKVLAMGGKRNVPTVENLRDLEEPFNLRFPEKFLYQK